jgi:hypothetical protein
MKHSPELERVIERMRPGVLSLHGFLGTDRRALETILDADNSAVAGLGLTHAELAEGLLAVFERAAAGLGTRVHVGDHLVADYREVMGRIPCPWGDGSCQKGEVTLVDTDTGETLRFTPLSIHMIAAHGFYDGRGARYRVDPERLIRMLALDDTTGEP